MLDDLAEMAMKLASRVTQRAPAEDPARPKSAAGDAPTDFAADNLAKLSRAVRLTLDLAGRPEETLRRLRTGEIAARAALRQDQEARASRAGMARAAPGATAPYQRWVTVKIEVRRSMA
jgi:hypothetical protein